MLVTWSLCGTGCVVRGSELDRLHADVEGLKKDVVTIKQLLAGRPAQPARSQIQKVDIARSPMLGNKDAPITIAEFSDYQCPYCASFFSNTFSQLKTEYIDTGKVRYVFRDFPLEQIHHEARKAHEAAHCAGEQGKYWEMHDMLFRNQKVLKPDVLTELAEQVQLAPSDFSKCMSTDTYAGEVDRNLREGKALNVAGTPTFFIGKTTSDDTFDGASVVGSQPIEAFRAAINDVLPVSQNNSN